MTHERVIVPATLLGWSPLHRAAFRGDVDDARALLDAGALVDVPARDGWTPLHVACLEGRVDVVRLLVERGAVVSPVAASLACASGDVATARTVHPGAPFGDDALLLFLRAHERAGHAVKKLRSAGESDGDFVGYSTSWNEGWRVDAPEPALDDDVLAYLGPHAKPRTSDAPVIVAGVDVVFGPLVDDEPDDALALCRGPHKDVYSTALGPHFAGDRPLPVERLRTLLVSAVRRAHGDVVDALLPATGATVAALDAAISVDDPILVARLSPDPNALLPGHPRHTALGVAARRNKPKAAVALLERGARVDQGGAGTTPLLLAVESTGPVALEVVIALLEHGASTAIAETKKGWTPLMRAALMGDAAIVERLLRAGADPNARDQHGMTPLAHADVGTSIGKGGKDVLELLLGFGARR